MCIRDRRGGDERAGRNPETPTAGGARVLQDISLPDIPSFDEEILPARGSPRAFDAIGAGSGGARAGADGAASTATARFDEWNMSGEIAREGEAAAAFSPGGWDLNSPLVLPETEETAVEAAVETTAAVEAPGPASETEDATRERLRVTDERSGAAEPAPAPAPAVAAPAAGAAGGPFGGEPRDDDAAFFERLDAAPPAPAAVEYPAASNAFFENAETAPEAPEAEKNAFSCLLYTSPSPRDRTRSRMPSSA